MTRSIPPSLAPLLALLELERPSVVTTGQLRAFVAEAGVATPAHVVIHRLAERGWLLATGQRGVWEFSPAENAGPFSRQDPWLTLRAAREADPDVEAVVALGSALWLLDLSDRRPDRGEIAVPPGVHASAGLARAYRVTHFRAALLPVERGGVPVHRSATVLVHLAHRPASVRNWGAILDVLPALVDAADRGEVREELRQRGHATHVRLAYLLSGVAPDLVDELHVAPAGKVWFGPRRRLRRHNARWNIADTVLPLDPARLRGLERLAL